MARRVFQGVQLAKLQALVRYWGKEYDWRKVEARLNSLPMFVTTIDGIEIHFIHVKSRRPNALPLLITQGWPGSILEIVKAIAHLLIPPLLAVVRRTPSTLSFRQCLAMGSLANRRQPAGAPIALD
jgi:hypothetical protein